jgi:amidase
MSFPEYDQVDGLGLAALVAAGEVSPRELLDEAIARAERVNPRLNAIVLRMDAEARERAAAPPPGPFRGVPFLLKDLAVTHAGTPLQNGSRLFEGFIPDRDAELVARYKAAGLVIFGRTNTPEFGLVPTTEPVLYGAAHNPWRLGHSTGGSSGGAAAAVASGVVPLAHGSDGGGSIRIPASCCGVFGMKPTRGRLPCGPDMSELFFGFAIDHALTRSVRDSAALLDATAGPEPTSPYHAPPVNGTFLAAAGTPPGRLRIAYTSEPLLPAPGVHPDCRAAVEDAARLCASLGHDVVEARPHFDARRFAKDFFYVFCTGAGAQLDVLEEMFGRPIGPGDVETTTWLMAMIGRRLGAAAFGASLHRLQDASRDIQRFFKDHDVLLTPTLAKPPRRQGEILPRGLEAWVHGFVAKRSLHSVLRIQKIIDLAVDRAYAFSPFTPVFNVTGQPSMSVPLWWSREELPIGAMFSGRFGDEATLFRLAGQLEEARPWRDRRPPVWAG